MMTKAEWELCSHSLRKLLYRFRKEETDDRSVSVEYRFGLAYNPPRGYYHLWDGLLAHTIATIRPMDSETVVRVGQSIFRNEILKFRGDGKTVFVPSETITRHDQWADQRIGDRVQRAMREHAGFLARQVAGATAFQSSPTSEYLQELTHWSRHYLSFDMTLSPRTRTVVYFHDETGLMNDQNRATQMMSFLSDRSWGIPPQLWYQELVGLFTEAEQMQPLRGAQIEPANTDAIFQQITTTMDYSPRFIDSSAYENLRETTEWLGANSITVPFLSDVPEPDLEDADV